MPFRLLSGHLALGTSVSSPAIHLLFHSLALHYQYAACHSGESVCNSLIKPGFISPTLGNFCCCGNGESTQATCRGAKQIRLSEKPGRGGWKQHQKCVFFPSNGKEKLVDVAIIVAVNILMSHVFSRLRHLQFACRPYWCLTLWALTPQW